MCHHHVNCWLCIFLWLHVFGCIFAAGVVTPLNRRRQIYSICRKHDVIILEDDPYFYLQFSVGDVAPRGLQDLGASYLSLDVDGRVIRLDSFSKVSSYASLCCPTCLRPLGLLLGTEAPDMTPDREDFSFLDLPFSSLFFSAFLVLSTRLPTLLPPLMVALGRTLARRHHFSVCLVDVNE